jgi:sulfur relay (sulfurtransferase) DsrF/TusC family protein
MKAISHISPHCDSNYGEAIAAHLAASLAVSLNIGEFVLEGDSIVVILALQNPSQVLDWKFCQFDY